MVEKKTKIICTISDLRCDVNFLTKLFESGMNIVRINSAHASVEGAQKNSGQRPCGLGQDRDSC